MLVSYPLPKTTWRYMAQPNTPGGHCVASHWLYLHPRRKIIDFSEKQMCDKSTYFFPTQRYACDPHIAEFLLPPEADTTVTKTSTAAIDSSANSLVQQHQHEKESTTAGILKSSGGKLQPAEATTDPSTSDHDTTNALQQEIHQISLAFRKNHRAHHF